MTTYGLIPDAPGFLPKPRDAILADIEADQRASLGQDLDTSPEEVVGKMNAIAADQIAELWAVAGKLYAAHDPRTAKGDALDAVAAISGTWREGAGRGSVALTLQVAAGRTIPAGAVASVTGQSTNRWVTAVDAVNPSTTATSDVIVGATAEQPGAFAAPLGSITVIATPMTGWLGVTNTHAATPGLPGEDDAALRVRREEGLSGRLRAALLALRWRGGNRILSRVMVVENTTDRTTYETLLDGEGAPRVDNLGNRFPPLERPGHSVEVVVSPAPFVNGLSPDDAAALMAQFASELWRIKPGGVSYAGTDSAAVLDSSGVARTVRYSSFQAVAVHVALAITVDRATYAGDDAVKAAVRAYFETAPSTIIRRSRVSGSFINVRGVLDCLVCNVWRGSDTPAEKNVPISPREFAMLNSIYVGVYP